MNDSSRARRQFASRNHKNSAQQKGSPYLRFGAVAVGCVVLACAWTVYTNVFGASVYPVATVDNSEVIVVKRAPASAVRSAAVATPAFNDVFASLTAPEPLSSSRGNLTAGPSPSFSDRFAAAAPQGEASRAAEAPKEALQQVARSVVAVPAPNRQVAEIAPLPAQKPAALRLAAQPQPTPTRGDRVREMTQGAKAAVMAAVAEKEGPSVFEKLFGKLKSSSSMLSYASADASATGSVGPTQNPALAGSAPFDRTTAVYDISAHVVYMPDGTKLEAHSGLGSKLDDPKFVNVKMQGPTPPHVYDLEPREALFHGVPALRLTPIGGEEAIFGRTGLLAHTYMLGPNGDSNGCVSFKDYNKFLQAYQRGQIKRLVVVANRS